MVVYKWANNFHFSKIDNIYLYIILSWKITKNAVLFQYLKFLKVAISFQSKPSNAWFGRWLFHVGLHYSVSQIQPTSYNVAPKDKQAELSLPSNDNFLSVTGRKYCQSSYKTLLLLAKVLNISNYWNTLEIHNFKATQHLIQHSWAYGVLRS